jgi:putative ABC transport system substrate-binding protein
LAALAGLSSASWPAGSSAQSRTLALVSLGRYAAPIPQVRGFYHGLEEAGYTLKKNLIVHEIKGDSPEQLRAGLAALAGRKIDAIVATSATDAQIAKEFSKTIPIVFIPARDPRRNGLVQSLARPGGNVTGLSYSHDAEDSAKQLAVFKQYVPKLRRGLLFYPERQTAEETLEAVRRAARLLGVDLLVSPVASIGAAEAAAGKLLTAEHNGILFVCSALFRGLDRLSALAMQKKAPVFGCSASQVSDEGSLMTYAPDIYLLGYRGAWYVDRILKGAKPQDLPVEVPNKFHTVVNLRTAESLGIAIPPEKLILADKVFQ